MKRSPVTVGSQKRPGAFRVQNEGTGEEVEGESGYLAKELGVVWQWMPNYLGRMELISPFSFCVLSIEALCLEKKVIAPATAFLIQTAGRQFLVTNFHVLAGRHPYTDFGELTPEFLRVKYRIEIPGSELPKLQVVEHALFDEDRNPLWVSLPVEKRRLPVEGNGIKLAVDVGILEVFDIPQKTGHLSFTRPHEFHIEPLERIAIIGYPLNLSGTEDLPIWLSGTVASDLANRPYRKCMFVDARSRPGSSGSLVVLKTAGASQYYPGGIMDRKGNHSYPIGIYSGRVTKESEIGLVWHWNSIEQLLESVIPLQHQDWKTMEERTGQAIKVPVLPPGRSLNV
jgi:hypothetical protein